MSYRSGQLGNPWAAALHVSSTHPASAVQRKQPTASHPTHTSGAGSVCTQGAPESRGAVDGDPDALQPTSTTNESTADFMNRPTIQRREGFTP